MAAPKKLLIVESPAKIKTISKFLGKDYKIMASYGHVRDLPSRTLGVDLKKNFEPTYANMKDKAKVIKELKTFSKTAEEIYIATDPDREGEAIAWHIINAIKVPDSKIKRIVFNEITKTAIQQAISESREINMKLVNAQQARRVLDRLIGYKLSPVLSRKIRKGLSAGRVQSVAVKMICDREKEIKSFVSEEYWLVDVQLNKVGDKQDFWARLAAKDDPKNKLELGNKADTDTVLKTLKTASYAIKELKKSKVNRRPAPPFITSTLQQDASGKLNWTAKKTMMIAQKLYEDGHITYMRTDSTRVSDEARGASKSYIEKQYGKAYLSPTGGVFKQKKNAQDAHEAIRPAYVDQSPDKLNQLNGDTLKLYALIWQRFMASQMSPCVSDRTQVLVEAKPSTPKDPVYFLRATGSIVIFEGFTVVYAEKIESKSDDKTDQNHRLPQLQEKDDLNQKKIDAAQKFTQPPPRYTEASLVKVMEEEGIGRPSTYAPTLSTIQDREYVTKDNKALVPSELGQLVNEKLEGYFEKIIDRKFTANMETQLDEIIEGKHTWQSVVGDFYGPFSELINVAYEKMEKVNTDKPSDEICEKCNSPMVIKAGRYGEFLACTNFPDCRNTKRIIKEVGVNCPDCGKPIAERKSKRGKVFYGCSGYPDCKFASWDRPIPTPCPDCKAPFMLSKDPKGQKTYCPKCNEAKKAKK